MPATSLSEPDASTNFLMNDTSSSSSDASHSGITSIATAITSFHCNFIIILNYIKVNL